ncbi:MAG: LEPR-XLL domain-containing protein, partial [Verrucomicrobiae bacterium]
MDNSAKHLKNRFELEALEPRVLLSADGALAVAAIGHAAHQPTEVVVVDHGVSQAAAAYQPAESGGIFDGVSTQAIESSVAVTNPAVHAKTTTTATVSAVSVTKVSTAATPISATSTTTSGGAVTQQLTTSLTVANAPPVSGNASQSSNNQSFIPKSNLSSNSSTPVFSSTVTPLIVTPAVDLVASINAAITAIASGGPTTALDFDSATLGGILKLNTVHISFTVSGTTVTGVGITAASASLFPGNSDISGTITPTTAGGNGVVGQYNVTTKLFSLQIQKLHLTVGSAMTADASNFTLAYNPTGSASQLLAQINNATVSFTQFTVAGSPTNATVGGNLTSLTLNANGFQFAVAPLNYSGQVNLGPLLTITDSTVTLTDFSVTFGADNATFTTTGSLTAAAATATLNIGNGGTLFSSPDSQFSATATDLVMTVNLDPASATAGFGDLAVTAGAVNFQFNDQLSVQASDVDIATNPLAGDNFLTIDTAVSTLVLPVSGLTLHGTAEDFSVVNNAGNPELLKGANFGVSIVATADQLKLPAWLTFKITSLEIKWADFVAKPDEFEMVLNADITAIKNVTPVPNGTGVEGFISDAVINLELLDIGLFPITSIKGGGGNIDIDVFVGEIKATLIIGLVNINAEGGWIHEDGLSVTNADGTITVKNSDGTFTVQNPDGTTVTNPLAVDNLDLTVAHSSFYVGARGTFDLPGMKGFSCEIGFSALGPLSFYLSVDIKKPIVIDPESG